MRRKLDTRAKILKAAYDEFQKRGYKQADINTIVKKAGVTKGALYYYFKSKEDLADNVITCEIAGKVDRRFLRHLSREGVSLQTTLSKMALDLSDEEVEKGTIFVKFANEIPDRQKGTHTRVRQIVEQMVAGLCDKIECDRAAGRITQPVDPEHLAQTICALMMGSLTLSKTYSDREVFINVIEQMNSLIDNVYEQKGCGGIEHNESTP